MATGKGSSMHANGTRMQMNTYANEQESLFADELSSLDSL